MGYYQRAEDIFRQILKNSPQDDLSLLWLVEANLNVNDQPDIERYLKQLLAIVPANELRDLLQADPGKHFLPAASKAKILELIEDSAT